MTHFALPERKKIEIDKFHKPAHHPDKRKVGQRVVLVPAADVAVVSREPTLLHPHVAAIESLSGNRYDNRTESYTVFVECKSMKNMLDANYVSYGLTTHAAHPIRFQCTTTCPQN
jgi:hypothetical protein